MSAHWGVADPAAAEGDDVQIMAAFRKACRELENQIKIFTSLPLKELDRVSLKKHLDDIGASRLPEGEE